MSIDSADKRASAFNYNSFLLILPIPDGTIGNPDKQHLLDSYSGIAFAEPAAQPLLPDDLFTARRIIGATLNPKSDIKIIKVSSGNI